MSWLLLLLQGRRTTASKRAMERGEDGTEACPKVGQNMEQGMKQERGGGDANKEASIFWLARYFLRFPSVDSELGFRHDEYLEECLGMPQESSPFEVYGRPNDQSKQTQRIGFESTMHICRQNATQCYTYRHLVVLTDFNHTNGT